MTAFYSFVHRGLMRPAGKVQDICEKCGGFVGESQHECGQPDDETTALAMRLEAEALNPATT